MSDQDQTIACKDCRVDFVFTAGEAQFYADKGFQIPRRCKSCRALKKAQDQGQPNYAAAEAPTEPQQPSNNRKKGGRRDNRDDRY